MRICFFAPVRDRSFLTLNEFYAQDLRIVRSIASDVTVATRPSELAVSCDLYFIWWWTWAFLPLTLARARRRPAIVTGTMDLENPIPGMGFYSRPRHERALIAFALKNASANIFVSEYEMNGVACALPTRNPLTAPHVVDGDTYRFSAGARDSFLLTIGHLDRGSVIRKGIDVAVAAHARLVKTGHLRELRIAGTPGDGLPYLQDLARSHGTEHLVRFLGRIEHEEKVRLMQTCAAYLQPSTFEGFGLAAAEAMACGAPVAAFRLGALPEVLGDDAHYAVRRTVDDFAVTINAAVESNDARRRAAAQRIVTRCSVLQREAVVRDAIRGVTQGNSHHYSRTEPAGPTPAPAGGRTDVLAYWRDLVRPSSTDDLAQVGHPDMGTAFNRSAYALRLKALERALRDVSVEPRTACVFEAAYGTGFYLEYWRARGCKHVCGVDISEGACARGQINFPNYDLRVGDLATLDKQQDWRELLGRFDVVTAIDVIYHLVDDDRAALAMTHLAALLGAGGIMVLTEKPQGLDGPRTEASIVRRRPWRWYDDILGRRGLVREVTLPVMWGMDPPSRFAARTPSYRLSRALWVGMRAPLKLSGFVPSIQERLGSAIGPVGRSIDAALLKVTQRTPSLEMAVYRYPSAPRGSGNMQPKQDG